MKERQIALGIRGIRVLLRENKSGWHVFLDDKYRGYLNHDVDTLRDTFKYATLTGYTGNGIYFSTTHGKDQK